MQEKDLEVVKGNADDFKKRVEYMREHLPHLESEEITKGAHRIHTIIHGLEQMFTVYRDLVVAEIEESPEKQRLMEGVQVFQQMLDDGHAILNDHLAELSKRGIEYKSPEDTPHE